jgi:hypothetical protein
VDKREARGIALAQVSDLRQQTWEQLRDRYLNNPQTVEISGESAVVYQVQTQAVWDSRVDGDLRVMVAVDDGGWRAFVPLSEDFIVAPDGSFVDE